MTGLLAAARSYLARGWSVIPLIPGTKRPAIELAPFLSGARRLGVTELGLHFQEGSGIGIIGGTPSGNLVVVDVDPRNGGDKQAALSEVQTEYIVSTGGGGLHLYLQGVAPIPKGKTSRPGVDRIADGGYVVAPPTPGYAFLSTGTLGDVVTAPQWIFTSPLPQSSEEPRERWLAETLASPETCPPGHQEETLTRLAWWAAGHLDEDIAQAVLWTWLSQVPLGNLGDPWTQDHVADRLRRAYDRRPREFTVESARASSYHDNTKASAYGSGPAHGTPPHGGVAVPPCPASAVQPLASLEFPEQSWIVPDFVTPGGLTEVVGKVKKGKSTLVYQLIRAVLQGSEFLGRPCVQSPVILVTEQEGGSLRATLERAGLYGTDLPLLVVRKAGLASLGAWPDAIGRVTDVAEWVGAKLLVIDTLSRLSQLYGDAENRSGAVAVLDPFDRAKTAGIGCLFVRHARKSSAQAGSGAEDAADFARGTSALTGDMDIVIRLRPAPSGDLRILSWESRLTDDPDDIALRYVDGRYEIVEMPEGKQATERNRRLDEMRAALRSGARSNAELERVLGWSHHTIERYKRIALEGERLPEPPAQDDGRVKL